MNSQLMILSRKHENNIKKGRGFEKENEERARLRVLLEQQSSSRTCLPAENCYSKQVSTYFSCLLRTMIAT
jgi:hypothetical protein